MQYTQADGTMTAFNLVLAARPANIADRINSLLFSLSKPSIKETVAKNEYRANGISTIAVPASLRTIGVKVNSAAATAPPKTPKNRLPQTNRLTLTRRKQPN